MKKRFVLCTTAAALALGAFAPAFAQTTYDPVLQPSTPYPGERIYVPAARPSGAVHGGFVAPGDEQLLSDAVAAFSDKRLDGSTVTIVAKNGELIVNGSAKDFAQATRMAQLAKKVSGGHSTAWFDSPGA